MDNLRADLDNLKNEVSEMNKRLLLSQQTLKHDVSGVSARLDSITNTVSKILEALGDKSKVNECLLTAMREVNSVMVALQQAGEQLEQRVEILELGIRKE